MRKILIGVFIGFTLSFAVGAHAEVINTIKNIIGQTVQGQFPVTVNGVKLDEPAAVIKVGTEDKGYLPIRAIGDSLGVDITFDSNLGIFINGKPKTVGDAVYQPMTRRQTIFPENPPLTADEQQLSELSNKYEKINFDKLQISSNMSVYENTGKEKDQQYHDWKKQVDEFNRQLKDLEPQIQQLTETKN